MSSGKRPNGFVVLSLVLLVIIVSASATYAVNTMLSELVSSSSTMDSRYPAIAVGPSNPYIIHVVWEDDTELNESGYGGAIQNGPDKDIFYIYKNRTEWSPRYLEGGSLIGGLEVVSNSSFTSSENPAIAVGYNNITHIVWQGIIKPDPLIEDSSTTFLAHFDNPDSFNADFASGEAAATSTEGVTFSSNALHNRSVHIVDGDTFTYDAANNIVTSKGTIELWYNPQHIPRKLDQYNLFQAYDSDGNYLSIRIIDVGAIFLQAERYYNESNSLIIRYVPPYELKKNTWHHIAFTYDFSAGDCRLYFDGNLEAVNSSCQGTPLTPTSFMVGGKTHPYLSRERAEGLIDELRLSNSVRTADEIRADAGQMDILYRSLNGTAWSSTDVVTYDDSNNSYFPRIGADKNNTLSIVWNSFHNSTYSTVSYKRKTRQSADWPAAEAVGSGTRNYFPDIAVDIHNNSHVVWQNVDTGTFSGFSTIQYRKRNQTAWDGISNVSNRTLDLFGVNPGNQRSAFLFSKPRVAIGGNNATHIAWSTQAAFPDDDLLFYVSFDDKSPNVTFANGSVVSHANGTYIAFGGYNVTESLINTGYAAYVNDTYLNYSASGNMNMEYGTIMMWVKPDWDPGSKEPLDTNVIFMYYSRNASESYIGNYISFYIKQCDGTAYTCADTGSALLYFHIYNATFNFIASYNITDWDADDWHHIAATWDATGGSSTMHMYIDGKAVENSKFPTSPNDVLPMAFNSTPTEIILGNSFNESTDNYPFTFNGTIDELMIFDRMLGTNEIDAARKKDLDIIYRQKNDSGWQDYELVSKFSHKLSAMPSIAAKDDHVYVVWPYSLSTYEFIANNYRYGSFNGILMNTRNSTSWRLMEHVNDESAEEAYAPDIEAVRSGKIDIVWEDMIRLSENDINVLYKEFGNTTSPAVALTYPLGGEWVTGNITMEASTSDPDSTVSNVSFYYITDESGSGKLICTATSAPYSCLWNIGPTSEDLYKVKAIATSDDGGRNWSSSSYFYIDSSPYVQLYTFNYSGNDIGNHAIYKKAWLESNLSGRSNISDAGNIGEDVTSTARANISSADSQWYVISEDLSCVSYNLTNAIITKFYINESPENISSIKLQWVGYGYAENGYPTNLSIWDFNASSWKSLDYWNFAEDENRDMKYSLTSGFENYVDSTNRTMYVMVETLEHHEYDCGGGWGTFLCPLYQSWNGTDYNFETEGILGLFSRHTEIPTYDRLYHIKPYNGSLRIRVSEVVNETTYLDNAELIIIDHSDDADVMLDFNGTPHTIKDPKKVFCRDRFGNDCTSLVEKADERPVGARSSFENGLVGSRSLFDPLLKNGPEGNYWVSNLSALDLSSMEGRRDYIELTLPKPCEKEDEEGDECDEDSDIVKLIVGVSDTGFLGESEANLFGLAGDTLPLLYKLLENPSVGKLGGRGITSTAAIKIQVLDENNGWVDYPERFDNALAGSYRTLLFPLKKALIRDNRIRINALVYASMIDYVAADYSQDEEVVVQRVKPDIESLEEKDNIRLQLTIGDSVEISFTESEKADSEKAHSGADGPAAQKNARSYFLKTEGYYHPGEDSENIGSMKKDEEDTRGIIDIISAFSKIKNGALYARMMHNPSYAEEYMLDYYFRTKRDGQQIKNGYEAGVKKNHNSLYTDFLSVIVAGCIVPTDNIEIWTNASFCANAYFTVPDLDGNGRVVQILGDYVTLDCKRSLLDSGRGDVKDAGTGIGVDWSNNVVVKNCNVSNYGVGIGSNGSRDALFLNNTVEGSYIGMGGDNTNNSVFRNNLIIGSSYVGLGLASDSTNNTIVNNSVINTTLLAYALEGADNTTMEFNIANGSANRGFLHLAGIGLTKGAYYNTIRNNTIKGLALGIGMVDVGLFQKQASYGISGSYNNFSSNIISNMVINGIGLLYPYDEDYYNYFDQNNMVMGERVYYYFDVHGNETDYVQINSLNLTAGNTSMFIGKLSFVNCSYINITNNNLSGNFYGLFIFDSHNILVSGNRIYNNGEVPVLTFTTLGTVVGAGYVIINSENISVTDNNATENFYGYYTRNSKNLTFINNKAQKNSWVGYYMNNTNASAFMNNTANLNDVAAYLFAYSWLNTITNNTAKDALEIEPGDSKSERRKGFYFAYTFNNTITNNIASNCSYGFYMYAANETLTTFTNNTMKNNSVAGVLFASCLAGSIMNETSNTVENNTGMGYFFSACNNAIVKNLNTTKNNGAGFGIYGSHDTFLSNLWSKNNYMGYLFNTSNNNTLVNSQTINSTSHEVYFYDSRDNKIVDSIITNNVSGNDAYSTTDSWNYFINTSLNESNFGDDTNSNASVQRYLDLFVQDNETVPVAAASIWLNDTLANTYSGLTDSYARARLNLTDFVAGGGSNTEYDNYTWNVTKIGYMSDVAMTNMTKNRNYTVTINLQGGIADVSAPTPPNVFDGYDYIDYEWTNNATTLFASWNNATDRHLIFYGYRILENGTCLPAKCAPTEVDQSTQIMITGLSLVEGNNYSIGVRARDTMYYYAPFVYSDGIMVDITPPNVTANSSTHPNSSQWYSNPNVTFTFYGNDSLSGIAGYSYVLDEDSGTGPDLVEEARAETTLESMRNTGHSKTLRANSTGSAFAVFSEIRANLSAGDNVTVRVALIEDFSDTINEMSVKAYLISSATAINTYEMDRYAISDIQTSNADISHKSPQDADSFSFNLVSTRNSTGSFYVAVASVLLDDNNTHNISIAGTSTSLDNTTQSFICEEGVVSCTNTTNTFDYAIEVKRRENSTVWSKKYTNLANGEHWFHVRAKDVAGNWGNPAHFRAMIDSVNGTPLFTTVKPVGYIATTEPTLVVGTNEYTDCYYNTTNTTYTAMTSYDGIYHEANLVGIPEGTHTYSFNCTDRAGNSAYNDTTFIIDLSAIPDAVSIYPMGNYTAGKTVTANFNVTKSYSGVSYGLGELARYVTANLTNSTDTYKIASSVKDLGNGKYTLYFTAPLKAGAYTLTIAVRTASGTRDFTVASYSLTVKYVSNDISAMKTMTRLVYSTVGSSYIIGLGGDSSAATTSGSTTSQIQIAGPAVYNNLYLFITKATGEPGSASKYMDGASFMDLRNPSFGYPKEQEEHVLSAMLEYKDISIIGNNKVQEGRYTLLIKNEGINQTTGKTKVSVTII